MERAYIKSPTHPACTRQPAVTIATEEEVRIFKGQAAAQGELVEITMLSSPLY